jgi:hypothetical protein
MHKDQSEKKIKMKDFLLRIAHDLVTPFVTQRYKLSSLPKKSKQQLSCVDLSLILKKTPYRSLKTTRPYQESEGAVMYAAGVEM